MRLRFCQKYLFDTKVDSIIVACFNVCFMHSQNLFTLFLKARLPSFINFIDRLLVSLNQSSPSRKISVRTASDFYLMLVYGIRISGAITSEILRSACEAIITISSATVSGLNNRSFLASGEAAHRIGVSIGAGHMQ